MANATLRAESACANPIHRIKPNANDFMPLLNALHEAEAACALADDADSEEQDRLSDIHTDALHAFMLSPAKSMRHLAWKLKTYQSDDLKDWFLSDAFIAAMVADADNLA